jgi:hypothetical protein
MAWCCICAAWAAAQEDRSLSPDLSFWFDCRGDAYPASEPAIENFLAARGFRVLNKVRLARERNVHLHFTLNIVAIDRRQGIVKLMGFPHSDGSYSVGLYTAPPTRRAIETESALLGLVTEIGCTTRQIARNENSSERIGYYEELFQLYEGWFQQAENMQRPRT